MIRRAALRGAFIAFALAFAPAVRAQVAVVAQPKHEQLLASADTRLAANKRLVYDFWREVLEAGHVDIASRYLAEGYIQHNPNIATGRAAFIEAFSKRVPRPIESAIKQPLVSIVAEGDLVVLCFLREAADPNDATKKYTTTWFDMFRVENGKIVEHWDVAQKT